MDVSKVRLRVKKADGDDLKPAPEPRTRDRRKAEMSEDADSSIGPINLSIKKSGKTHLDGESAKKPTSEPVKEKSCEKRAEKRSAPRNEGKETSSKKVRIKETVPCVEKQDGKKDKEVKKSEKVAKSGEKVTKSRAKKAAKEKKETLTKNQDGSEQEKRADLQKRQQNQRMEKEMKAKEQKQREEEERRERKKQEDERLEKKEKERKQREEEERREREHQEKERIEQEMRAKELMQKEMEEKRERERVEKEMREKEKKEEEQKERERLERELRAKELKKKEEEEQRERDRLERDMRAKELKKKKEEEERRERVERKMREKELKQKEEEWRVRERLEEERKLQINDVQGREVENKGFKKAPGRKASKKQTGAVSRDVVENSQKREEGEPKKVKRKAESAPSPQEEKAKRRKVKVANSPRTSKSPPAEVKRSKGNSRQSRKTNKSVVGAEVPSTCMETDEATKALEPSCDTEKVQSSPVKDQISTEKLSCTSEELSITKNLSEKPPLEDEVRRIKATSERQSTMEAHASSDIDSGMDSPTLDLFKTPCSKSQEGEDDEGIHSHDGGSDISDCASEVSYDSGLNGKLPDTPTEEIPSPTQLLSHTCVFCDRTFPLEMDYRRHLNRHLVNVYYLDTATQQNK